MNREPSGSGEFETIPVIDFGGMLSGEPLAKARAAEAVRDACTNVGFFYLANHGVAGDLIEEMFMQCRRFFALPLDQKMLLHVKLSAHLLGYIAMQDEKTNALAKQGDLHEAFDFVPPDLRDGEDILAGDFRQVGNLWPADFPGFQETLLRYSVAMKRLSRLIFRAFALALELPEGYFTELTDRPMTLVRMLHYPSQPGPFDEARLGTGAHTDHECFTILRQDDVKALQVRNRRGAWIDAPPMPGAFVVNVGDQMARWTNGLFASTPHRVANLSGRARHSIPCFVGANADAVIQALPNCVSAENPAKFAPVVAGEYVSALIYHNLNGNQQPHPLKVATALGAPRQIKGPPFGAALWLGISEINSKTFDTSEMNVPPRYEKGWTGMGPGPTKKFNLS